MSPFFSLLSFLRKGVLFQHDFLVAGGSGSGAGACLPSSFIVLFSGNGVLFSGSGSGSGTFLPSSLFFLFFGKGICFIMMSWFLLVPARVQVLVSLLLSFFLFSGNGVLFHHDFLVPGGSGSGAGACLPSSFFLLFSGNGLCSIMISWFLLVPVLVLVLVSLLSLVRKRVLFHSNFPVSPRSGSGSGASVPSSPFFSFCQENGFVPPRLHGSVSTQASCAPFSVSSLTNEFRNEQ